MEHRMLCLDNSEWMRNGDYNPTRMKAQRDAANIVCTRHLSANPENTVGIMTLAGPRCTIHATQCSDNPRLHRAISLENTPIGGKCRVVNGIKIARLALKNRPNQKGEARIVLFVGSPLREELKDFQKVGRDLKKNSCGISVILLGEVGDNKEKMEALVEAARKEEGQRCDLIIVPPGVTPLEVVRNSPLCTPGHQYASGTTGGGAGGDAPAGAGAGTDGEDEMARALRLSLLESQGAAAAAGGNDVPPEAMSEEEQIRRALELSMLDSAPASAPAPAPAPAAEGDSAAGNVNGDGADEEDESQRLIQQALAMSTAENAEDNNNDDGDGDDDDDDEAAMFAAAVAASLAEEGEGDDTAPADSNTAASSAPALPDASGADAGFSDPDFVRNLLATIPGASIDDPLIQAALAEAQQIESEKSGEDKSKKDGEGDEKK